VRGVDAPTRAVGKLFVVPAGALPLPISGSCIGLCRALNRRIFSAAGQSSSHQPSKVAQHVRWGNKVANRDVFPAHAAVSRRPPISLYTTIARNHMCAYAVRVWDLPLVQGPFAVTRPIRNFSRPTAHTLTPERTGAC
jgi:hypothetical protein